MRSATSSTDGLKEFNETVNPFFADWGLPAIIKRMPIRRRRSSSSRWARCAASSTSDSIRDPEVPPRLLAKAKVKLADLS